MKEKLTLSYSLEWLTLAAAGVGFLAVAYTFIIGKHYVIPTGLLVGAIVLANLGYHGIQNKLWARNILFWSAVVICAHTFFALFWAKAPRDLLGQSFIPVYGFACVLFGYLAYTHARFALPQKANN
ncbi:MAG TPA: hypothetical protein EYQ14_03030 [Gammaproteobacteria bacterium]|nr:hypothetical protein [Gammaproteobacteria bacterium]